MSDIKTTDNLIDQLAEDLAPVKVLPHPLRMAAPWLVFAVLYITFAVLFIGVRGDFSDKITDPLYVLEIVLVLMMSISAAFCALWMSVPDMRGQKWMIGVPLSFFSVFAVWTVLRVFMDSYTLPDLGWHVCILEAIVFGVVPAFAIWYLSTRGKTTRPYMISFMNVLSIGGLGYIGLRISCGLDDIGHIGLYHLAPYLVFGFFTSVVGGKIYRW